MVQLKLILFNK